MAQIREPAEWDGLSDEEFASAAEMQIWLSAFANNNPRAPAHAEADKAYDSAKRMERVDLYKQAWRKAAGRDT